MRFEVLKNLAGEGPLTVIVKGGCMQQSIADGSRLQLEHRWRYWPGDVVAFKREDGVIVSHRLLGYAPSRNGWRVVTRAENAGEIDSPVLVRNVLGKVTGVDNVAFNPGISKRLRAQVQYFGAVIRWIVFRLRRKLGNHDG